MRILITVFSILFLPLLNNCSETPTKSGDSNQSGSRDYYWTIDTIKSGSIQTYMKCLWGTSSSSVWMSGYDADNSKCIYYYDGTRWSASLIPPTYFLKDFEAVEGNGPGNVFFIGAAEYYNPSPPPNFLDSALVLQFIDGSWNFHYISNSRLLVALCVIDENEVWVGGAAGSLFRYNGSIWEKYFLGNEDLLINGIVDVGSNEIYATGHAERIIQGQGAYIADYLYRHNGNNWALIDSNIISNNYNRVSYPTLIRNINGNIYGSGDIGFVKKTGDGWQAVKPDIHGQFNGTDENNIFLANQDFGVLHYNGQDWYRFEKLPWLYYYDVEVFDDAVFLLATDGYTSYIVKGITNK